MKSIAVPVVRKSLTASKKKRTGRSAASMTGDREVVIAPLNRARVVAAASRPVVGHRYHVGQHLRMADGGRLWARPDTICRVLALLPIEGGPLRYRVRSETESFERTVHEVDLTIPA